jgi:Ca2+/Na+ antiporter
MYSSIKDMGNVEGAIQRVFVVKTECQSRETVYFNWWCFKKHKLLDFFALTGSFFLWSFFLFLSVIWSRIFSFWFLLFLSWFLFLLLFWHLVNLKKEKTHKIILFFSMYIKYKRASKWSKHIAFKKQTDKEYLYSKYGWYQSLINRNIQKRANKTETQCCTFLKMLYFTSSWNVVRFASTWYVSSANKL